MNVGARQGVCRDFAVLGYCDKGLDCDKQHVRECPDFAEKGICSTKGCKLPHVIRANRNRKPAPIALTTAPTDSPPSQLTVGSVSLGTNNDSSLEQQPPQSLVTVDQAQLGDEYISLTFNESESSEEGTEDEDEEDEDEDEDDSEGEEGSDPNDDEMEPE